MPSLKDTMQGRPLRSPLHPALVHLPVALLPLGVLLDLASWLPGLADAGLVRAAFLAIAAGLGTGLLAGVFGLVDYVDIRDDHPAKKTATLHLVLNVLALGLFALGLGLRHGALEAARTPPLPLVVSLVALGVLAWSGYLGGHLVYGDGVGVGRHRRRTRLPPATLHPPREAAGPAGEAEQLPVADAAALREGETLRVEIDGFVATLARTSSGAVCAFQEFCPHRFGPLSEGCIEGDEIVCPWHQSRFAMRTGRVVRGPAKVDLRTLRAEERDGRIWLSRPAPE